MGLSLREQVRLLAESPGLEGNPKAQEALAKATRMLKENPLLGFEPHPAGKDGRQPQLEFIEARTPVVAAFAGTRFGKSTVLGVCALRECLGDEVLPPVLQSTKRFRAPVSGWILVPTEDKIADSFEPVFRKWCPPSEFKGGSWGKAFNGGNNTLRFKNGSMIAFKTYKQDASTLGGAALHFVGYDEPPPKKHREEGMWRLGDYGGYEMFAMTPLDTNTGYIRREIYKKRESPDITVVSGSVHDNPTLDKETIRRALGSTSDIYRAAREFGIFVDVGGLIYPDFEGCVVKPPSSLLDRRGWEFDAEFIRTLDVVCGYDPGIRNAGFAWVGFDRDLTAYVFSEGLKQDLETPEHAAFIKAENARWGLREVAYVADPAQRERGKVNSTTVKSSLAQHGIYANDGQNDHTAGFDQMRSRMRHGRLLVSPSCIGLRAEADDYAAKEPAEDKDDSHLEPVEVNAHRLAALRYAVMERFWDPVIEDEAPVQSLGWSPGFAPPSERFVGRVEAPPMGSMS